jgi:hypothetical protein
MFLAVRQAGAKDWRSNIAIALDHSGTHHKLQFHHIFPKAVLRDGYTPRQADDIANLAFIAGRTNRGISDKPPVDYLPGVIKEAGDGALGAQSIPTDPNLWRLEAYKDFLSTRRRAIAEKLNDFLGILQS